MRRRWTGTLLALVTIMAVACGGGDESGADPDEAVTLEPTPTDDGAEPTEASGTEEEQPVSGDDPEAFAVADAAQRADADPADVTVVVNEEVTWPDGALGCPSPGQFYTQALVEGYRVVVEVDGERFHYHGRTGEPPSYCANPSEPARDDGVVDR